MFFNTWVWGVSKHCFHCFLFIIGLPLFLGAQITKEEAYSIASKLETNAVVSEKGVQHIRNWINMETPWRSYVTRGQNPIPDGFPPGTILRSDMLTLLGQLFNQSTYIRSEEDAFYAAQAERRYPLTDSARIALQRAYIAWYPSSEGGRLEASLSLDHGLNPKPRQLSMECFGLFAEYWPDELSEDLLGPDISTTGRSCFRLLVALERSNLITRKEKNKASELVEGEEILSEECLIVRLHEFVTNSENQSIRSSRRLAYKQLLLSLGVTDFATLEQWEGDGGLPELQAENFENLSRCLVRESDVIDGHEPAGIFEGYMKWLNDLIPEADFTSCLLKDTLISAAGDTESTKVVSYKELKEGGVIYNSLAITLYRFFPQYYSGSEPPSSALNQALITKGSVFRLRSLGFRQNDEKYIGIDLLLTEAEWELLDKALGSHSTKGSLWREDVIAERVKMIKALELSDLIPVLSQQAKEQAYAHMVNLPLNALPSEVAEIYGLEQLEMNYSETIDTGYILDLVRRAEGLAKGAFVVNSDLKNNANEVLISVDNIVHRLDINPFSEASYLWLNDLNKKLREAGKGEFYLTALDRGPATYCFLSSNQRKALEENFPDFFWNRRSLREFRNH